MPCNTWICRYCGPAKSREWQWVVEQDAVVDPPTAWATLTLRDPLSRVDRERLRRSFERLTEAVRRLAPGFRTLRVAHLDVAADRVHFHVLAKGIARDLLDDVASLVKTVWHHRTGAHDNRVDPLTDTRGGIGYPLRAAALAVPGPLRWRRVVASDGYWHRPLDSLRAQYRAERRGRREPQRVGGPRRSLPGQVAA